MSIDELGRAAAREARRRAANGVDPMTMLEQLRRTRRNRTAGSVVAVVAVCAAIVAIVLTASQSGKSGPEPAVKTPAPTGRCGGPSVQCLSGHRFRIDLPVPVTVRPPANFGADFNVVATGVEDYRTDVQTTGVTLMENAIPVRYDGSWRRDPAAGTTASSMASWLAGRPFVVQARVTHVHVGGLPAERVSTSLKHDAAFPALDAGVALAPTFSGGDFRSGFRTDLVYSEYTLVDVPGAGVTVIWSWSLGHMGHEQEAVAQNQAYVDALSFG